MHVRIFHYGINKIHDKGAVQGRPKIHFSPIAIVIADFPDIFNVPNSKIPDLGHFQVLYF